MPLRDHFRPPVSDLSSWEEVHGGWPMVIVQQLGRILPDRYVAAPRVHLGSEFEVDISAFERVDGDRNGGHAQSATSPSPWAATQPTVLLETELADADEYEVRIYDTRRNRRLVAAVELISPSNKDRPKARAQFVSKCEALLRQSVSLVLVDVVTISNFDLYAELLDWVGGRDPALGDTPPATYAAACRWGPVGERMMLEAWSHPLVVGSRCQSCRYGWVRMWRCRWILSRVTNRPAGICGSRENDDGVSKARAACCLGSARRTNLISKRTPAASCRSFQGKIGPAPMTGGHKRTTSQPGCTPSKIGKPRATPTETPCRSMTGQK